MPDYIVKTHEGRNLIITADEYSYDGKAELHLFLTNHKVVATVPFNAAFSVAEYDDAYQADYHNDDSDPLEDEAPCLCNALDDFSKSETFFDTVVSIIEYYHNVIAKETAEAPVQACPVPETPTAVPDVQTEQYPIEHWRTVSGEEFYGFWVGGKFVHFTYKDTAELGREDQINKPESVVWAYKDLIGGTRLED
jgi:hypothetical protein